MKVARAGDGSDTFVALDGFGDDTIIGGDGGSNVDTIDLSNLTGGVTVTYITDNQGTITDGINSVAFSGIENVIVTDQADVINASGLASGIDISGEGGADNIVGSADADSLSGDAGDDTIFGGSQNDTILGGDGNDVLDGQWEDDSIFGGAGDDTLIAGFGTDVFDGGDDNDTLQITGSAVGSYGFSINLTTGTDTYINTYANIENITGGTGDDTFTVDGADTLSGNDGNDTLLGGDGDNSIDGGSGNDSLIGGLGVTRSPVAMVTVISMGGDGDDFLRTGEGQDTLIGGACNDTISDFNTGTLGDGDNTNNDFINLSEYYDDIFELHADQADDGVLNQSNTTGPDAVDYSDNGQFAPDEGITFTGASADNSSFTSENTGVVCFTTGTAIRAPCGDLVTTKDNGPQRIAWIGQRHVTHSELLQNDRLLPVLIKKGILGAERNLLVSRQHGMLLGQDHLARAIHLAKTMPGIRVAKGKRQVTYVHLMFEAHQIIFAEGIPSESFYPGPMALEMLSNASRQEMLLIFPKVTAAIQREEVIAAYGETARAFLENKQAVSAWQSDGTDVVKKEIRKWDVDLAMEQFEGVLMRDMSPAKHGLNEVWRTA